MLSKANIKIKKIDSKENSITIKNLHRNQIYTISSDEIFKKQKHNQIFHEKEPCLKYIKTNPNLYLVAEDKSTKFNKRFYALDHKILYQLSIKKIYNLYEGFEENDKIKLGIDIDIKKHNIPSNIDKDNLFEQITAQSINLILKELEKYKVFNPSIIIISANVEDKLSAHIVFNDVVFKDIYSCGFFMDQIKSKLIDDEIIDLNIYKAGSLRMLWSSKYGKNNNLEYFKGINYTYIDDNKLFMDCLLRNIPEKYQFVNIEVPKNVKIIKKRLPKTTNNGLNMNVKNRNKNLNINEVNTKQFIKPVELLKKYINLIDVKRADRYKKWLEIGMCLHNCNPTEKCFKLWNEWSKLSDNYNSRDFNAYKWNSFKFGHFSMGTLKFLAKNDSPAKYEEIEYSLEKPLYESINFNESFIMDEHDNIKDQKNITAKMIVNWMEGNKKSFAINSAYNTSKSTTVKKILTEFNPAKVLFVSYRQTLTHEMDGSYSKLGITNYLNPFYDPNRLICQIESLHKLLNDDYFIGEDKIIPEYDLVVLDEIESILAHMRSSTILNKEKIFNLLRDIIYNADKVLALDGDFHNRSYEFLKFFGEPIILKNDHKKDKKHFIFTNNRQNFEIMIDNDLIAGKVLVLVNLSSKIATYFYNKYKDLYKCVLHCANLDDKLKKELKNVNEFWMKFDLVIYSPSIEGGLSFDKEHFDKIYIILSSKSTSPRGTMQMASRVRKIKDPNVHVYLNNLPFREKANFYTYSEIKEYVCEIHSKYLEPIIVLDTEIDKMVIKYEFDLYAKILVHNETEIANKCRGFFVPYFIKLLTEKGHTYEYKDIRFSKKSINKDVVLKEEVLKAEDIDDRQLNTLIMKQKNNLATYVDKMTIQKHLYKKNWKIKEVNSEFMDKYYGKTPKLLNLRFLLDPNKIDPYIQDENNDYFIDFDKSYKLEQIKIIKEVINKLGFDKPDDGKLLDKETFVKNIEIVKKECELFINPNKCQPLFEFNKMKLINVETIKQFMGLINSIFSDWGIIINHKQKFSKIKIDGKRKSIAKSFYFLNYIDNINNYV